MTKKKNLYLFQPQYGVELRKEKTYWLPYSAGCIWSYVSQFPKITENFELKDLIFRREHPSSIMTRLEDPAVCGFSCYIWNEKYCLHVAELIKQQWPNCYIIFGGPQANGGLLKYEFIDSIVISEGEELFLNLLTNILENRPPEQIYTKKRLENLDIPSPYLTGVFDNIIKDNPDVIWSMVFESNRGCPYSCTFCDWGGTTYSKIKKFELERVRDELYWAAENPVSYLYNADANFGIFKERDLEIAKLIREVGNRSRIDGVYFNYAKNSTTFAFEIAKTLGDMSRGLTISLQSNNIDTLTAIKRVNMDINNVSKMLEESKKHGVSTYTELIIGLPEETLETWKEGLAQVLELGQHNAIEIYFAQLLVNSELASPESRRKYGIKTVRTFDYYVSWYNPDDWTECPEDFELICATNTMTTDDIIEGYLFGWVIYHMHVTGYSQVIARYLRKKYNVPYRKFYETMLEKIKLHEKFSKQYEKHKHELEIFLRPTDENSGGTHSGKHMHKSSIEYFFANRNATLDLAVEVGNELATVPDFVANMQKYLIYDPNQTYPTTIKAGISLDTWEEGDYIFEVVPRFDPKVSDIYFARRRELLKNKFILLQDQCDY